ncbi:MAG: M56 family metallopeptidase [Candidatus Hydrogenedentes bacterium]|nr:M56 family metallopeptidase [Candidatus Hydrogenedentota bacterium]
MFDWAAMLIGLSYGPAVLLKATVLLACAWIVHAALRGRNPRWRVLLWRATLVGLAVLPAAEWALPRLEVALVEETAPPPRAAPVMTKPLALPMEQFAPVEAPLRAADSHPIESAPPPFALSAWIAGHFRDILGVVWVLVSSLLLSGAARAWRRVHITVARSTVASNDVRSLAERVANELGVAERFDVRIVEEPGSPFLTGVRRPVIVLPARCLDESDATQLKAILAHELAHVKTRDPLWMAIAQLTASLLWFHPLTWRMRSAHNAACEDVCDSVAAAYLGSPEIYLKTLAREALALLDAKPVRGSVPMLRSAEIVQRLRKIQRGVSAKPLARRWVAASLLVAAGLFVTLGSLKLVHARPAEDDLSESESRPTSDGRIEDRVATAKPDWVLPSIDTGLAGEEPAAEVPGLQVELLGVVGEEPALIAADGRGVEPDAWGQRVENAIRTHWEDLRERRFGATENGTNIGLVFRLRPEDQTLREYELLDAKLDRGNLSSSAVLTVGGPVGTRAEDRVQIMQIRSEQALELPDLVNVTATVSYGPPLDTYADIPIDAGSSAIEMEEWKFTATVRKLPGTTPADEIPHEERPEVTLTFSSGGPLVNFRVVAIDQEGNPIEPYADPHLDDLRHDHEYTWKFGFPEPISKQSIQSFRLIGYPIQPVTWKNVPFVTNTGAGE